MKVTIYCRNGATEEINNIFSVDDDGDTYTLYRSTDICEIFSISVDDVALIKLKKEDKNE